MNLAWLLIGILLGLNMNADNCVTPEKRVPMQMHRVQSEIRVLLVVMRHDTARDMRTFLVSEYDEYPNCYRRALWYVMQSHGAVQYYADCIDAERSEA